MITVMILAGGAGSRVGADRPKQFIEVDGKPVIAYTIEKFQKNAQIDAIEIVYRKEWGNYVKKTVEMFSFSKVRYMVEGGDTFQNSVINGIRYLEGKIKNTDYVLIHYAAAPFTSQKIIDDVIRVMLKKKFSFSATPCFQLMGTNDGSVSKNWVNRDEYVQIASPYGFLFSYLKDVYKRAKERNILDTIEPHVTSLMYALGDTLYQAYGDQTNLKITTSADLVMLKAYAELEKLEM